MSISDEDYMKARQAILSLKKHGVLKGDHMPELDYLNLWNACLEIVTGESVSVENEIESNIN